MRISTRSRRPERRAKPRDRRGWDLARALGLGLVALASSLGLGIASARDRAAPVAPAYLAPIADEAGRSEPELLAAASPLPARPPPRQPTALTAAMKNHGWNKCMMPDPGFGPYTRWQNVAMGQMIMPARGGRTEDGGYDVVVHFHGHDAVRKALVEVARGVVLVGIDLGVGSGIYADALARAETFTKLLASVESRLKKTSGDPRAHIRHLALSSWSAGYGAVVDVLRDHADAIDAVVLLDSLHSGYVKGPPHDMRAIGGVWSGPLGPAIAYAKRAALSEKTMILTHSEIRPPGYASTGEVADFLLGEVAGVRVPMQGTTPLGAELSTGADLGGLRVRGYKGGDEQAHCAHTELLAEIVRDVLEPQWDTPVAERAAAPR